MGKFISGLLPTTTWTNGTITAQCRDQLAPAGRHDAENDGSNDWQQPQRKSEGRGWADMKATTGRGGKR
jgi:hypothetical protein